MEIIILKKTVISNCRNVNLKNEGCVIVLFSHSKTINWVIISTFYWK